MAAFRAFYERAAIVTAAFGPKHVDPEHVDLEHVDPEHVDPEHVDPEHVDPEHVDPEHVDLALDAFRRFGKGRHPASLNFGDCLSYALAKTTGELLLFRADDFAKPNVPQAGL